MSGQKVDLTCAQWRKASASNGGGGGCVEIADNIDGIIAVRDSKDPSGPALIFNLFEWECFRRGRQGRRVRPSITGSHSFFNGLVHEKHLSGRIGYVGSTVVGRHRMPVVVVGHRPRLRGLSSSFARVRSHG